MPDTTTSRAMTARYRGACLMCAAPIQPGDAIEQFARKVTTHAGSCAEQLKAEGPEYIAELAQRASSSRRRRSSTSSTWKQRYGRCEDAPCCGCCGTGSSYWDGGY